MFTVVIPIYNHARYLRSAVASCIKSQLVKEVLLVDDGSQDDSATIAAKLALSAPYLIKNLTTDQSINKGAHARLNELCQAATQPWIAVLNSDDLFINHRFESAELLIKLTECEFLSGSIEIIDDEGLPIGVKRGVLNPEYTCEIFDRMTGPLQTDELRQVLCNQNILATTSNMLFTKRIFNKIGGFSDLRYSHDWDFALRATMHGKCLWTPNPLTLYRLHCNNTIKESSPHKDGENVRFFYRFLSDFPALLQNELLVLSLKSNRYLNPFVERPYSVGVNSNFPVSKLNSLKLSEKRRLINCALGFGLFNYEILLLTDTLKCFECDNEFLVVHREFFHSLSLESLSGFPASYKKSSLAHMLRLPGLPMGTLSTYFNSINVDKVGSLMKPECINAIESGDAEALSVFNMLLKPQSAKKRCLVLPAFFAVGGVERNTVEVMHELLNEYEFVVVTTERHESAQGSLHHQLDDLGIISIDINELAPSAHHLIILAQIQSAYLPDIVWICNGSPWLVENSLAIRRLFARAAIIDQQVYDTEIGWIEHYHKKGIQSFDRFIAINQKIQKKFISGIGIPKHRVDLIYPTLNKNRILSANDQYASHYFGREKLSLPVSVNLFVFVGRLCPQKRPLLFLELAKMVQATNSSDYFLMIGDGPLSVDCDKFIDLHQLKNIRRIPFHENPAVIFTISDGLIITSEYEGLPIVMLEALCCGLPVLSTDVGDIKVVLGEYNSGIVIDGNLDAVKLMESFLQWRERLSSMKSNASIKKDSVMARFSSHTIGRQYMSCFNLALS
jgi:glycosyltransferase involved in cell wall biosynthesis